ncbi:MAG: c-type cytochrome [Polyangiaceae bacterium]
MNAHHPKLAVCILFLAGACGTHIDTVTARGDAEEHGRALFRDPAASPSQSNTFSCATCHPSDDGTTRIFAGASLGGAVGRSSLWGGQENDLLRSINDCRAYFMDAASPWTADDEDAKAIYAYLLALEPKSTAPAAFTRVIAIADVPRGDAAIGASVFRETCQSCHGSLHDGAGKLATFVPSLPDDTATSHASLGAAAVRLVFIEKIRHGAFVSTGSMPPFSREVLSDADVGNLLAYLGQ